MIKLIPQFNNSKIWISSTITPKPWEKKYNAKQEYKQPEVLCRKTEGADTG